MLLILLLADHNDVCGGYRQGMVVGAFRPPLSKYTAARSALEFIVLNVFDDHLDTIAGA